MSNPNCDGSYCGCNSTGEVRVLPLGGSANGILCHRCYEHEIAYRRQRNKALAVDCAFDLPVWESLEVYAVAQQSEWLLLAAEQLREHANGVL